MFQRFSSFVAILLAVAPLAAADPVGTDFQTIFDGKSLDGWKHAGNWFIEDGILTRKGKGGDIRFEKFKVPDDFELTFEWKVAKGSNSGVYYRPGQYEYQILDNKVHNDGKNPRTSAASVYFCMPPSKDATNPVGEWNKGRIVCKGSVIQHWLNGEKVIDFDYTDPKWAFEVELLKVRGAKLADRGANLYLQDHGDPVWYRNIKIRSIGAEENIQHTVDVVPATVPENILKNEKTYLENGKKRAK